MTKAVNIRITIESKTINTKRIVLDQSSDDVTIGFDLLSYTDITWSIPKRLVSVGRYNIQLPLISEFYSSVNNDCSQEVLGLIMRDESDEGNQKLGIKYPSDPLVPDRKENEDKSEIDQNFSNTKEGNSSVISDARDKIISGIKVKGKHWKILIITWILMTCLTKNKMFIWLVWKSILLRAIPKKRKR